MRSSNVWTTKPWQRSYTSDVWALTAYYLLPNLNFKITYKIFYPNITPHIIKFIWRRKKTRTVFTIVFQYLDSALAQRQSVQFDSVKTWNKLPTNLQESTCAIQEMLQNLYFYCRLKLLLLILLQLFYYLCFKRIMFIIIYLHLWNKLLSIPAKGVFSYLQAFGFNWNILSLLTCILVLSGILLNKYEFNWIELCRLTIKGTSIHGLWLI